MNRLDILLIGAMAAAVAVVAHGFVRRYWGAVLVGGAATSLVNMAHELGQHDFAVRPSDAAFWLPMLFIQGMVLASPVVAMVGIPFCIFRRRRLHDDG